MYRALAIDTYGKWPCRDCKLCQNVDVSSGGWSTIFKLGRLLGRKVEGGVVRGSGGVWRARPCRRGKRRMGVGGSCRDLFRRVEGGRKGGS